MSQDVAVGVEDALREPGRPRGVIELRRVVGGRVGSLSLIVDALQRRVVEDQHLLDEVTGHPVNLVGRADDQLRLRVGDAVADALVAVEDGHREQDRAELPGTEEDRRGLGRRGRDNRDSVAALHPVCAQDVGRARRQRLQLAPLHPPLVPAKVLPHHRKLVRGMFLADVSCDVVAVRDLPAVRGARLLIGANRTPGTRYCHQVSSRFGGHSLLSLLLPIRGDILSRSTYELEEGCPSLGRPSPGTRCWLRVDAGTISSLSLKSDRWRDLNPRPPDYEIELSTTAQLLSR